MIADIKLVASREISEKLRSRGFLVFTALMAIGLPAAVVAMGVFSGRDAASYHVAVVGKESGQPGQAGQPGQPGRLGELIEERAGAFGATVEVIRQSTPQAAKRAVREGDLDAAVVAGSRVLTDGALDNQLGALLQSSAQRMQTLETLRESGVTGDQARAALTPQPLTVVALGEESGESRASLLVVSTGIILLFFALLLYGSWISTGVVEEKSSRVIEVVLSAVRPVRLLAGKVIGIGLLAIGQLALSVGLALAVGMVSDVALPSVTLTAVLSILLWFVLGFAFYCCLFAIAGSLVSKQEDLQYTQLPALLPIVVAYFLAIQSQVGGLSAGLAHALAYVPPLSPMLVPVLTASGEMAGWEVPLAAVLTLASAVALMRVAARLYSGSVLRFGERVPLREAWRPQH